MHQHRINRRDLLKLSAGAVVALGAPQILTGCGDDETPPKPTSTPPGPSTRVAAIRGNDLYAMTRDALEAIGGIGAIVHEGETVFIKPNMVMLPWADVLGSPFPTGECTKPEIVITVAEECLKAGAAEVIIGDGSQAPTFSWESAVTLDGSTNLVAAAARLSSQYKGKVRTVCLDAESPSWVEVPTSTYLEKVAISSLVANADRVISIPVVKTHQWAQVTLALKGFVGVTPLERYGWTNSGMYARVLIPHQSPQHIAQLYLDIANAVKPDLAIIDLSIGVEGNGPSVSGGGGKTVDMRDRLGSWLLLASTDLVAADATTARVIGHDVASLKHVGMAYEMGLGEMREESIEIVGEKLDNLRVDWLPAELAAPDFLAGPSFNPAGVPLHVRWHHGAGSRA